MDDGRCGALRGTGRHLESLRPPPCPLGGTKLPCSLGLVAYPLESSGSPDVSATKNSGLKQTLSSGEKRERRRRLSMPGCVPCLKVCPLHFSPGVFGG